CLTYSWFMASASMPSFISTVSLTASSRLEPAALRTLSRLRRAQSVCSRTSPIWPVSRLRPAWPEVNTRLPARMAWLNGPVGVGAWSVRIARFSVDMCVGEMGDQIAFDGGQVVEHRLAGSHRVAGLDRADDALVLAELGAMH